MRFLASTLVALLISLTQGNAPPSPPDPVYEQLQSPKMSGETASVSELTIRRDAATFIFIRGDFYFVEPVQGKVMAAVFIGDGLFRMQPPTEVEKHYLANFTKDTYLAEPFSELVIHFTDNTYDEITRGTSPGKGSANRRALSLLQNRLDLLKKGKEFSNPNLITLSFLNYDLPARLVTDVYDSAGAGFFNAFIKGKRFENLMFRLDPRGLPALEPEEVMLASFSDGDLGVWNSFHLQDHYRDAAHVADEDHRPMSIRHQDINATIKGTDLQAKVRTTIEVVAEGARVLNFDLYPKLRVTRVGEGEQTLKFIQQNSESGSNLSIIFPEPLKRGVHQIDFEYGGDGALEQQGSGNFALVARESWYPAQGFGSRATYDMTFHIPKDLVLVASGQPQGSSQIGNELVTRWKSDVPLAVAGFNFGRFKKTEVKDEKTKYIIESYANTIAMDELHDVPNSYATNFDTTRMMDKAQNEAQLSIGIYQKYFGNLPYGRLAMTQQPYPNFGQAWPMLVYMPITAFFDSTTRHNIGWGGGRADDFFKIVAPHEVAHQWWGHIVGWKSYRDQWMSEGFAEFSASLFAHLVYGDAQFLDFWKDQRERILEKNQFGKRPADVASVTMGYRADNSRTGDVTRNLIYPKGAFILHMIRMMMYDNKTGDERFIAMMRDFVMTHYNQNVSTEDFKAIVEKHMTADMDIAGTRTMDWFFDQYVYGTDIPRYKLDYQLTPSGQQTELKLRLTQSEVSDKFRMAVPVYLETEGNKLTKLGAVRVLGNSSQEATVMLGFRPNRVVLAAYEDVLANIDQR